MREWRSDVMDRLRDGEWTTDVAIPLIVALASIYMAVRLVKAQMAADLRMRRADRKVEQLRPLMANLSQMVERLESSPASSSDSRQFWASRVWPDERVGLDAIASAIPYLTPSARQTLTHVCASISSGWRSIADVEIPAEPNRRAVAVRQTLAPLTSTLKQSVTQLEQWDGSGDIPELASTRSTSINASPDSWAAEFRRILNSF